MADNFNICDTPVGGSVDTADFAAQDSTTLESTTNPARSFVKEVMVVDATVTAFETAVTITPASTASKFGRGQVEIWAGGVTQNVGSGFRSSRWYFDVSNGAPTVAKVGTDTVSGSGAPDFQLTVSGSDILVQAKSSDGTNTAVLNISAKVYVPNASVDWTVT